MHRTMRTATALLVLGATSCAVNPATGERQISLVSEGQEIQIGQESDPAITAQMGGLYPDDELQAYVTRLGMSLAEVSERPDLPWSFKLLDDDLINAFALPGGFIYVTRGILGYMNSEAELVGVLGHEVGHVTARHTANRITRQQLGTIGVVAGAVFSETVRDNAGAALQGLQLLMLRYSRQDESQSDALGYRYMTRVNYHPDGISDVMAMLQSTSPSAEEMGIPTWMLSHPDPGNRIEANQERLARDRESGVTFEGYEMGRDRLLDRLDGMVFGKDPNQGYFIETRFLHPVLEFELTFPGGWAAQNGAQAVQAISPERDAILSLAFSQETSAQAAMAAFMGQDGVTRVPGVGAEQRRDGDIGGRVHGGDGTGKPLGDDPLCRIRGGRVRDPGVRSLDLVDRLPGGGGRHPAELPTAHRPPPPRRGSPPHRHRSPRPGHVVPGVPGPLPLVRRGRAGRPRQPGRAGRGAAGGPSDEKDHGGPDPHGIDAERVLPGPMTRPNWPGS